MRGDWPKTVPHVSEQELADPRIAVLDARLPDLEQVFHHDFARDGLPAKYFTRPANKPAPVVTADGLLHTDRSTDGGWAHSLLKPAIQMVGDFDVTVRFDDLTTPALHCSCGIAAYIGNGSHIEVVRRRGEPKVERVHATFATRSPDGNFRHDGDYLTTEALDGSFRLTRRGDIYTTLFADGDSSVFRVIGEHTWADSSEQPVTLDLRSIAFASGATQVVWQDIRIAAQELMLLPDPSQRPRGVVFVMNADGSELKQVTQAMPAYQSHGSPDWSPDGKRIAFDGWTGNPSTSRVFVVNDDGTNLTDLGIGIMPTFSPDGDRLAFTFPRCAQNNSSGVTTKLTHHRFLARGSQNELLVQPAWLKSGDHFRQIGQFLDQRHAHRRHPRDGADTDQCHEEHILDKHSSIDSVLQPDDQSLDSSHRVILLGRKKGFFEHHAIRGGVAKQTYRIWHADLEQSVTPVFGELRISVLTISISY
jgi:hypothetical protein